MDTPGLNVNGRLDFGTLTPIKYDIMGPFALVPFMECRHSVISMRHPVWGALFHENIYGHNVFLMKAR